MRQTWIAQLFGFFLFGSVCAYGAEDERVIWACKTSHPGAKPIIHLVERGARSYVKFSSQRFSAQLKINEKSRSWYWHPGNDGFYQFAMVMDSYGRAWFHDFSSAPAGEDSPTALDFFLCRLDGTQP